MATTTLVQTAATAFDPERIPFQFLPPTLVPDDHNFQSRLFIRRPYISCLLYTNSGSTARDVLANERNWMSWLRLSLFLNVLTIAMALNFQLKSSPTPLEKRMSLPLGIILWVLSAAALVAGSGAYFSNLKTYARQLPSGRRTGKWTGWTFAIVTFGVMVLCVILIGTRAGET